MNPQKHKEFDAVKFYTADANCSNFYPFSKSTVFNFIKNKILIPFETLTTLRNSLLTIHYKQDKKNPVD